MATKKLGFPVKCPSCKFTTRCGSLDSPKQAIAEHKAKTSLHLDGKTIGGHQAYIEKPKPAVAHAEEDHATKVTPALGFWPLLEYVGFPKTTLRSEFMTYKVFYTDVPLPTGVKEPDFSKLILPTFGTIDAALLDACARIKQGAVVWKIEGPQGLVMDRAQVKKACNPQAPRPSGEGQVMGSTGGMPHKQHRDRNVQLPRRP